MGKGEGNRQEGFGGTSLSKGIIRRKVKGKEKGSVFGEKGGVYGPNKSEAEQACIHHHFTPPSTPILRNYKPRLNFLWAGGVK